MKLPCSVVRDVLPVYTEKLVEPETRELVDRHLAECAECRELLSGMKDSPTEPVETAVPLLNLKKQIRRQRWRAVLIAALCVFIILLTYFFHAGSMSLLPWKEGLVGVKGVESVTPADRVGRTYYIIDGRDGDYPPPQQYSGEALVLITDGSIAGTMCTDASEDNSTVTVFVQGLGKDHRGANPGGAEGELVIYPVPDRVIYGYSEPQKLLWGKPLDGGAQVLPRLALNYYLLFAGAAAIITGLLWLLFRKRKTSRIFRLIFFAPVSYIIAHLLINGLGGATFNMERNLTCILLIAAAIWLVLALAWETGDGSVSPQFLPVPVPSRSIRPARQPESPDDGRKR